MVRSLFRCFPVALGLVTPAPAAPAADPPPNVVIVMIDTLRPDHLALYGYGTVTSPFLDDLGDRSLVFRRATSTSSWTAPAVASLFTGLYPQQHGVTLGLQAQRTTGGRQKLSAHRLAPDVRTLPEVFRRAGYATYGISTNVNVDQALGFQRGFDRFVRLEHVPLAGIADPIAGKTPANIPATAEHVDAVLREWEPDLRAADPWLLYLHFMDPHKPYHARPPWFEDPGPDGDGTVAAYDSEIAYLDRTLARIHERLGLGGHDIVVVVSDHGEEFGDHGGHGHKGGLHRELNRIVLMISAPGLGLRTGFVDERVSIVDVLPTLADLTGAKPPAAIRGWSVRGLLTGGQEAQDVRARLRDRVIFAHRISMPPKLEETWAAMSGPWRLLRSEASTALYQVDVDPGERTDVQDRHPDVAGQLEERLAEFRAGGRTREETVDVPMDDAQLEALRSLGYAQ